MLAAIERKLTALLGDGLVARAGLQVEEAPGPVAPVADGAALVMVSVSDAAPQPTFERGFVANLTAAAGASSRRILPLSFGARVDFRRRPAAGGTDAQLLDARTLLLDDLALGAHLLAAEEVRSGKAFASDGGEDAGFLVNDFHLEQATIDRDPSDLGLSASLQYRGAADIWPPGVTQAEGTIASIERVVAAKPIDVRVSDNPVMQGKTAELRVGPIGAGTATRRPLALGVRVISDLPPALRGTITSGADGAEPGLRIVSAGAASTVITYAAPTGNLGATRNEFVALHLATPDGQRGVFLGSAAIQLVPKAG